MFQKKKVCSMTFISKHFVIQDASSVEIVFENKVITLISILLYFFHINLLIFVN